MDAYLHGNEAEVGKIAPAAEQKHRRLKPVEPLYIGQCRGLTIFDLFDCPRSVKLQLAAYAREYLLELGTPWDKFRDLPRIAYPFFQVGRVTAPTLFQCAGADDNLPCPGAQQMYPMLKTRAAPTNLIVYPGENDELKVPSYLVHRMTSDIAWSDRWLSPPK